MGRGESAGKLARRWGPPVEERAEQRLKRGPRAADTAHSVSHGDMLLNVLGFGNGLTLVVATCASVVMVVFAYLILKPLLRTLPGKDTGLAALRAQHRSDTAGALSIEQRLNDAVAPPTRFDDEPEPDPFTVGGG